MMPDRRSSVVAASCLLVWILVLTSGVPHGASAGRAHSQPPGAAGRPDGQVPFADLPGAGDAVHDLRVERPSVPVYERYEVRFQLTTGARYPLFEFTRTPPPGVLPAVGVTVSGVITTPSGRTVVHPAFFTNDTAVVQPGSTDMYFEETGGSHWALRYSPREVGVHHVALVLEDAQGARRAEVGTFTASPPERPGFIEVSAANPRYFEFSNGQIYWPIGPAWLRDSDGYRRYRGTGQNFERVWMGGSGAYSTNWARWKSSAEDHGNEGVMTRLTAREPAPGHELSYELFYPEGYRMWISAWLDDAFHGRIRAGQTYRVRITYRTTKVAGPSDRCRACPYGLVVRASDNADAIWGNPGIERVERALRREQTVAGPFTEGPQWQTAETTFRARADAGNLHVYLDNVTAGQAYVAELSIRAVDQAGHVTGGEIVRNPSADQHTYVEARPAAFFDWQLEQAERNGVHIEYVVHDKNDWVQNHLDADGTFVEKQVPEGYYQPESSKASWLRRQWYRYVVARWGYSTAVHSFELNNEGPPDEVAGGTSPHWEAAQAFARYIHAIDGHRHLASTSFWCCWRPAFWGNHERFPDVDHADIHDYTHKSSVTDFAQVAVSADDVPGWMAAIGQMVQKSRVQKPVMLGENGLTGKDGRPVAALAAGNPGFWYHDMLWVQLNPGAVFAPNYWFSEHLDRIDRGAISAPFAKFVGTLDVHRGGYEDVEPRARISNQHVRVFGQVNPQRGAAYFWLQNRRHGWRTPDGGRHACTVTIAGFPPGRTFTLERWDTYSGAVQRGTATSNTAGEIRLEIPDLVRDAAFKIAPS